MEKVTLKKKNLKLVEADIRDVDAFEKVVNGIDSLFILISNDSALH